MKVEINSKICVTKPSKDLLLWCDENLILTNPKWQTLKKLGKEELIKRNFVPEKIKCFSRNGDTIFIPFGCLYGIWPLIKNSEISLNFNHTDNISIVNQECPVELFDYQKKAVDFMIKAKGGILMAPCASGKTFMGIEIIRRIGKKFLWMTHTGDLLRQTYSEMKKLYPCLDIGLITEGKVEIGKDGAITTVQTLSKIDQSLYAKDFEVVISDECVPFNTLINTPLGKREISSLKKGDIVCSYNVDKKIIENKRVLYVFKHKTNDTFRIIKLNNGKVLNCTSKHPIYTKRGYINAEEVKKNDYVLCTLKDSLIYQETIARQEKRRFFKWIRVENNSIQKQTSDGTFGGLCKDGFVYNIEVEDNNNYFIDDALVHNCHHTVGSPTISKMFSKCMESIAARYKYGLTATPKRSDTLINTMYALVGLSKDGKFKPTYSIDKKDIKTIVANHVMIPLDTPYDQDSEVFDTDGTIIYNNLINYLSYNEDRNKKIVENIKRCDLEGRKQVVLCHRVEHCYILEKMLLNEGIKCAVVTGKTTEKNRKAILNQEVEWNVLIATYSLLKEGVNIKELDTLHMTTPQKDKSMIIQCVGRIERFLENKKQPIAYDYVDIEFSYCLSAFKKRKGYIKNRF